MQIPWLVFAWYEFFMKQVFEQIIYLRDLIFRNKVDILVEKLFKQEDCTYRKLKIYHRSITNF